MSSLPATPSNNETTHYNSQQFAAHTLCTAITTHS